MSFTVAFFCATARPRDNDAEGVQQPRRGRSHWHQGQTAIAEHQRNISACRDGQETCDYSKLTAAEAKILATAEHKRNYTACLKGYGYCDPSRLTPSEANAIPVEQKPVVR